MENKDQSQGITNDNILGHFILIGIFFCSIFSKYFQLERQFSYSKVSRPNKFFGSIIHLLLMCFSINVIK